MKVKDEYYHRGILITKGKKILRGGFYVREWHFELNKEKFTEYSLEKTKAQLDFLLKK